MIPEVKSPAQVAAEKAAEWKKQQLEAEAAKKNKSYIKKRNPNDPDTSGQVQAKKELIFSALEEELRALADAQKDPRNPLNVKQDPNKRENIRHGLDIKKRPGQPVSKDEMNASFGRNSGRGNRRENYYKFKR